MINNIDKFNKKLIFNIKSYKFVRYSFNLILLAIEKKLKLSLFTRSFISRFYLITDYAHYDFFLNSFMVSFNKFLFLLVVYPKFYLLLLFFYFFYDSSSFFL